MRALRNICSLAGAAIICGIAAQAAANSVVAVVKAKTDGSLDSGQCQLRQFSDQGLSLKAANFVTTLGQLGRTFIHVGSVAGDNRAAMVGLNANGQTIPNCTVNNTTVQSAKFTTCEGTASSYSLVVD